MVYGSVQPQVKEALAEVRKLYEEKLLDDSFMLRTMANIAELIVDGKCGSFFGPWWAPNNPLMEAMEKNPDAVWEPYLIRTTEDGKLQYYDQNPSYKYVVVRKDFEHPEIVFKMASVMFDKMRTEGRYNEELAYYFQTNVDSRFSNMPIMKNAKIIWKIPSLQTRKPGRLMNPGSVPVLCWIIRIWRCAVLSFPGRRKP